MRKINKAGLAALLLVASLGSYTIGMESVRAADETAEVSQEFSNLPETEGEDLLEEDFLAEDSVTEAPEENIDQNKDAADSGETKMDLNTEPAEEIVSSEEKLEAEENNTAELELEEEEITDGSDSELQELDIADKDKLQSCGIEKNTVFWELDQDGVLKISGQGEMQNWENETEVPWSEQRQEIKKVEITEGVTSVGGYAFSNCINAAEIVIPDSVQEIGEYAFFNCNGLSSVTIG